VDLQLCSIDRQLSSYKFHFSGSTAVPVESFSAFRLNLDLQVRNISHKPSEVSSQTSCPTEADKGLIVGSPSLLASLTVGKSKCLVQASVSLGI
jgi:hypothetical protein